MSATGIRGGDDGAGDRTGRRAAVRRLLGVAAAVPLGAAGALGALATLASPADAARHAHDRARPRPHPRAHRRVVEHPTPRPGITAARVLAAEEVPRRARRAYAAAREIPQVLDGLYCHCDCAARDGLRSLLSCFETKMPAGCGYCREEAELALRLHRDGRSLAEIRRLVDEEFDD